VLWILAKSTPSLHYTKSVHGLSRIPPARTQTRPPTPGLYLRN